MVTVRWTGAAGLEFTYQGRTILVDPYHSRIRKTQVFFGRLHPDTRAIDRYLEGLPGRLSAIVTGHTHFDHALDIPVLAARYEGPLVGSRSLESLMAMHGMAERVTVCGGGERIDLPGHARVTMIPSRHGRVVLGRVPYTGEIDPAQAPPLRARDYRHGTVFSPKIEMGGTTFLHVGSADFIEAELEGHQCQVLFMCVPGWKRVPGYCRRLLEMVRPRVVVPFHFDDFSAPLREDGKAPALPFQDMAGFLKCISDCKPMPEILQKETFVPLTF